MQKAMILIGKRKQKEQPKTLTKEKIYFKGPGK